MMNQVKLHMSFTLPFTVNREDDWLVASCDVLDVHSQGRTEEEAEGNLREALQVFFETCIEMKTLDDVLQQYGFKLATVDLAPLLNQAALTPASVGDGSKGARFLDVPVELLGGTFGQNHTNRT